MDARIAAQQDGLTFDTATHPTLDRPTMANKIMQWYFPKPHSKTYKTVL
jgi:hypothetical protein